MHTIMETKDEGTDINNINNIINNNTLDVDFTKEKIQRYLSPTNSFIDKNDNKKVINILPILKKENNLRDKKKINNIKLIDNKNKK